MSYGRNMSWEDVAAGDAQPANFLDASESNQGVLVRIRCRIRAALIRATCVSRFLPARPEIPDKDWTVSQTPGTSRALEQDES